MNAIKLILFAMLLAGSLAILTTRAAPLVSDARLVCECQMP